MNRFQVNPVLTDIDESKIVNGSINEHTNKLGAIGDIQVLSAHNLANTPPSSRTNAKVSRQSVDNDRKFSFAQLTR